MKNPMRIGASIVCVMIVFMVIGSMIVALNKPDDIIQEPSGEPGTAIIHSPEDLYQQAVNSIALSRDLSFSIRTDTMTKIGEEIFSETSEQTVRYNNLGTASMTARVDDIRTWGSYVVPYSEAYTNNLMCCTIGGGKFCSPMSSSSFKKRFAPVILLDPACYKSSSVTSEDGTFLLKFEQPVAIEDWAAVENATLVSAAGTAVLDEQNNLLENTYSLTYTQDISEVTKTVHVIIRNSESVPIPQTSEYLPIDDPNAPLMLERACGYLMQATTVSAQTDETMLCEAFNDNRTQTLDINMHGKGQAFTANLDFNTLLVNSSQAGDEVQKTETSSFKNGKQTTLLNGIPVDDNKNITADEMRKKCQQYLLGTVLMPKYISGSISKTNDNTIRYEYTATNDLAKTLCQYVSSTLYEKPDLLLNLSSSYTTDSLTAYLEVSRNTGLPTSAGISYTGIYTIEDHPYLMKYATSQNYSLASQGSS